MSLKAIHIVFISASMVLTLFFGGWSWMQYFSPEGATMHLTYGVLSVVAFAVLIVYGKYFLRKLKHLGNL